MKVIISLKNGRKSKLDDVRMIKPLVNEHKIIVEYKQVCSFEFIDDKPKLQKVKWYIDKQELENIEIIEL
jgi:hypothetical protein